MFVRWQNLTVGSEEGRRLPGYKDPAVVRTFDAPEALDTRFYEVTAKSALNKVPGKSRMPFSWTINPYRGCSHACAYCVGPDTPILLADGTVRPLEDLSPGDRVVGTGELNGSRRYRHTTVLDHWETTKPAFVTRLEDGTELVTSGDHRLLTTRGWRYVDRAPRLMAGDLMMGPGRSGAQAGRSVQSLPGRVVAVIEPLQGDRRLYDITTGTGDFIANGVVSHNCFARPTHEYLDMNAGRDFEKEIIVKVNAPEVLRAELRRPSWKREHVALGTNTDPYQWVEGRYKLMRGIWEAMRDFRNPCSILTKSPLLLRDLDLMLEIAEVAEFSACLSIPTLDEKAWRATEPHTPHPMKRIEAVAKLNEAGIPTGVLIAPLMPGINDSPKQVDKLVALCGEAGAVSIGGVTLHLRGSVKGVFFEWLAEQRPDLLERYERLYGRRAYAPATERKRIQEVMRDARRKSPIVRTQPRRKYLRVPPPDPEPPELEPPDQKSLF
jgi:DNA repair photolyase